MKKIILAVIIFFPSLALGECNPDGPHPQFDCFDASGTYETSGGMTCGVDARTGEAVCSKKANDICAEVNGTPCQFADQAEAERHYNAAKDTIKAEQTFSAWLIREFVK